jgi:glycosyltransferase involved in cell wall biosynthesis
MNVTQVSIGRFHHFHLARQMERQGLLNCIWTGYPRFKLRDEQCISQEKICTFPWLQAPFMVGSRFDFAHWQWLKKKWAWWAQETLDRHVSSHIKEPTNLVALSGSGLHSGIAAQRAGGKFICDRGSAHIRFQDKILKEEYTLWGLKYEGIDPKVIAKEEQEYEQADRITVPSEFARKSFLDMGVHGRKLSKVVYGVRLERFQKVADPPKDRFRVLWVGVVSIQKGFLYLLEAFQELRHPGKELLVVGHLTPEIKALLPKYDMEGVIFKGHVANSDLPRIYSEAHVFVLPSIQEGLAMVQGESLACGCPVIASQNTGAEDIFTNGREGFIIPIRSSKSILECFQHLAEDKDLRLEMSEAAVQRVKALGGWNNYGDSFSKLIYSL